MASASSSSSLLFPSPFIYHNHGFFFSPPSRIRLSLYNLKSFSHSLALSREISNIPTNGVVNSNSVSTNAEESQQREPMAPPYNVLITGSTKGIGYALARQFLKAGDNVVICSRSAERVESSVQSLREEFGEQHVWINNAGSNAYSFKPLVEASDEDLIEVVTTNALGLMICCREAIKMMLNQPRGGHIFNIDGAGSDGRPTPRFAAYGATKRSVVHLTKSLQAELQMQDVKNVVVHNLSPGMVTTELLMSGANTKQAKFFINVLAEPPEVVAEYLVPNIRSIPTNGSTRPTYIRFLTGLKAYSQIFSRLAFGARRNRYLLED
ncbi:chlorophyll(ide) b reductase NOL, chloroplastic isoform X3 [Benincasa hispida]|uniref:chlorophyll(ide) b reductase NOL, chloroplastic isoform X3 n=1 Tax=Benincasa hispida TaxID=102211 RepID=UPI001901E87D|nr:chlorophyll(ide) b reductase NOL, chloroplastic isoform X3 [Benincasa hispida]